MGGDADAADASTERPCQPRLARPQVTERVIDMVTDLKTRKDASTLKQYRHAWDWTCDNVIGPLFLAALCLMSLLLLTGLMEP